MCTAVARTTGRYLMYVADAAGYLGYVAVILTRNPVVSARSYSAAQPAGRREAN